MNCERFGRSIHAWLMGELELDQRGPFEAHRDDCEPCRERLARHRRFRCRDLVGFLDRYLEQDLSQPEHEVFDLHLRRCPPCLEYLESYRVTVELARRGRGGEAGPDGAAMPEALMRAILEALGREE